MNHCRLGDLEDLNLPDGSGLELLTTLRVNRPATEVILMTGYGSLDIAIEALENASYVATRAPRKKR